MATIIEIHDEDDGTSDFSIEYDAELKYIRISLLEEHARQLDLTRTYKTFQTWHEAIDFVTYAIRQGLSLNHDNRNILNSRLLKAYEKRKVSS